MALLPDNRIEEIRDTLLNTPAFQYTAELRRLFFSSTNREFFQRLPVLQGVELIQLWNDLTELNRTERLADGTVPFGSWLDKVGRFVKPFPDASKVIEQALADIAKSNMSSSPINDPLPPSKPLLSNIVRERIIFKNDMLSYSFLEAGLKAGISVARMQVRRYDNGVPALMAANTPVIYLGTGWLMTKDLVMTNHHVINARNDNEPDAGKKDFELQASQTLVEFDFNTDNVKGIISTVTRLEAADSTLDYAILRIQQPINRNPLSLLPDNIVIESDKPQVVNIIQHPQGTAKKVALRNNHIYEVNYPLIRYFTDTDGGSSGSPVFNDNWEVIALHRASAFVDNVEYQNQKTAWVNEGVQIGSILGHLTKNWPQLAAEIKAA